MKTNERADVVVLGLGTGGEEIAGRLAIAGLDVVGIESELVGGECPYWACIPTKMMVRASNLLEEARRVNEVAGHASVEPEWGKVAERIRDHATGHWDDRAAVGRFEGRGGRFIRGRGRFLAPGVVTAADRTVIAQRGVVVSTGSQPTIPTIPGLQDVAYWTSRDAVAAATLPASLVILGGGAVGCELGQVFSRFGVAVTIVESHARLLPAEEPEVGELIGRRLSDAGIRVCTSRRATAVRPVGNGVEMTLEDGTQVEAEQLLVAVGRTPRIDDIGLDRAGVDTGAGYIRVDDHLRAAPGVWAMGDVTGKGLYTHVALYQASIVEASILGGSDVQPANYRSLPRVTFTDPEVAAVGMTEAVARDAGVAVATTVKDGAATFRGWIHGPGNDGLIKLIADRRTGTLVGATAVGPNAGETLGLLATAIHASLPLVDLRRMVYAFPTFHGGVGEAVGAYGRALVEVVDPDATPLLDGGPN